MSMQFATARHLNRLWKLLKKLINLSDAKIAALEKLIQTDELDDDVLAITDASYHILAAIDKRGIARFPVGMVSREAETEGDHRIGRRLSIKECRMEESDDQGIFYLLDNEYRILLWIDGAGNTDFKGIPTDIKAKLDALEARIKTLETQ